MEGRGHRFGRACKAEQKLARQGRQRQDRRPPSRARPAHRWRAGPGEGRARLGRPSQATSPGCPPQAGSGDFRYLLSPSRPGGLSGIYSNFHFIGVFVESTGIIHSWFCFSSSRDRIFVLRVQIRCQLNSPSIRGSFRGSECSGSQVWLEAEGA